MTLPKNVDDATIRKKMVLRLLASPMTLVPLVGGVTAMAGSLALAVRPDLGVLAGVVGLLAAGGSFLTQLLLDGVDHAKQAITEVQLEEHTARESALNELDARLVNDGDPRTESALRDLRQLLQAFDALFTGGYSADQSSVVFNIQSKTQEMAHQCFRSLEQSLTLWQTASALRIVAARQPILDRREEILRDVFASIQQMGRILVGLQEVLSARPGVSSLKQTRAELDQNLKVAKQVNARLHSLETELSESRE